MYPFTKQFMSYNSKLLNSTLALTSINLLGMLILDVKGNYSKQIKLFSNTLNLNNFLIILSLNSNVYYNPLHKPNLKPQVLADRLKTILLLFSENNSESFWLDKAHQVLTESIKLCRLYNNGYVTFLELHNLVTKPNYYKEKLLILKNKFISNSLSETEIYDLNMCMDFFEKEFLSLDSRTKNIIVSEITRITNVFVSDYEVAKMFCSDKESLTFTGFDDVLKNGKIVVLDMNVSEYSMLSKIIAAYLKLDFQSEVLSNLSKNTIYPSIFICDEYDKYCTKTDADFFSVSREAKCINIISTQSYSSLKNTLNDESSAKVIIQNLINKIWFRTDDIFTIEEAQKQLGKEDKQKISKSLSENAKETNFSYIANCFNSEDSSLSESFNVYTQYDYIYDTNYFTQKLETFTALCFLSDGTKIFTPCKINLFPFFKNL